MRLLVLVALLATAVWADPPKNAKWDVIPELTDEFNGAVLDCSKWLPTDPGWFGRQPGFFSTNNVAVSNGCLRLTTRLEEPPENLKKMGFHTYSTVAVKSKIRTRYGYYEVRAKPMASLGSSAFWFYHSSPEEWSEIDVFEICGLPSSKGTNYDRTLFMNLHVFHTPEVKKHDSYPKRWLSPVRFSDDFHIYALEWTPKAIRMYFDGELRAEWENTRWHQPLEMVFDSETMPEWFGLPTPDSLPSVFSIDYVRAWRRVGELDTAK